ncbi:hypothetical protein QL285_081168 [Trifolium repens]|nr:hypothetical protein QL285_081168 [Trifolium repens]
MTVKLRERFQRLKRLSEMLMEARNKLQHPYWIGKDAWKELEDILTYSSIWYVFPSIPSISVLFPFYIVHKWRFRLAIKVSCLQGKRTQKLSSWCFSRLLLLGCLSMTVKLRERFQRLKRLSEMLMEARNKLQHPYWIGKDAWKELEDILTYSSIWLQSLVENP